MRAYRITGSSRVIVTGTRPRPHTEHSLQRRQLDFSNDADGQRWLGFSSCIESVVHASECRLFVCFSCVIGHENFLDELAALSEGRIDGFGSHGARD
jgi:hypothetical protein